MKFFRNIAFLLLILLASMPYAQAQHYGFLGKKNYIEVNSVSSVPLIANIKYAWDDGEGLFGSWNFGSFNTGYRVSFTHSVKQNLAFGIEAGTDFMSYSYYDSWDSTTYRNENNCFNVMPKVEFARYKTILPMGVSHQIGLGYYSISAKYQYGNYTYEPEKLNGIGLLYAMTLRSAINKSLFVNYGVRYTLNYTLGYDNFLEGFGPFAKWYNIGEMDYQKRYNVISLVLGVSYAF